MRRESFSIHFGSPTEKATAVSSPFVTDAEARAARDRRYKELTRAGARAYRSVLKNQLRQYWDWDQPCGITANCYVVVFED